MSKGASLRRIAVAYVAALAVAVGWVVLGPDTSWLWLDSLIADVLATLVVFAFSRAHGNSSFYDAFWSVAPPLLLLHWWVEGGAADHYPRGWLVTVVVLLWAVRLTANWVQTFPGRHHEDWRYGMLRKRAGRWELPVDLLAIHLIPTMQVFLGMVPA